MRMHPSPPSRLPPTTRPLAWVASILYLTVLVGGGYFHLVGSPPVAAPATALFVGGIAFLLAVEALERWRWPEGAPRPAAVALLAVRTAGCLTLSIVDPSGFARALLLLIPFLAYVTLGRRAAYVLAATLLGLVVLRLPAGWHDDPEALSDLLMFAIGLVFAVSMASVAVRAQTYATQTRVYAAQVAALAAVAERNALARDLHDSLGHHLTAISVQLEKAAAYRQRDEAASAQALTDARACLRTALGEVRQSVSSLHADAFSLRTSLTELVRADPSVVAQIDGDEGGFAQASLLALYRVAQEALTNVRRHSGGARVAIRVEFGHDAARLVVSDDGRGFDVAQAQAGFGLRGMRERIELVGGTLRLTSAPGKGTEVTAVVPSGAAPAVVGSRSLAVPA